MSAAFLPQLNFVFNKLLMSLLTPAGLSSLEYFFLNRPKFDLGGNARDRCSDVC